MKLVHALSAVACCLVKSLFVDRSAPAQQANASWTLAEKAKATFHHENKCGKMYTPQACMFPELAKNFTSALVVATFMEDIHWINEMEWDGNISVLIHDRAQQRSHSSHEEHADNAGVAEASEGEVKMMNPLREKPVEFIDIPNRGDEASAYLAWIIQKYNKLPEVVFFVQGHRCAEHAKFDMAKALPSIRNCFEGERFEKGYYDINFYREGGWTRCQDTFEIMEHPIMGFHLEKFHSLWLSLFQSEFGNMPNKICYDAYAQFAVTRERIRKHPLEFYKKLFRATVNGETTMEFFWRTIFVPEDALKN